MCTTIFLDLGVFWILYTTSLIQVIILYAASHDEWSLGDFFFLRVWRLSHTQSPRDSYLIVPSSHPITGHLQVFTAIDVDVVYVVY
jgi:hypothetical protein